MEVHHTPQKQKREEAMGVSDAGTPRFLKADRKREIWGSMGYSTPNHNHFSVYSHVVSV
jgi:hypothetical protein